MDENEPIAVELPARRAVRHADYFPAVAGAYLNARTWAREDPDLVSLCRLNAKARIHAADEMRNSLWSIRNHRVMRVESVVDAVRNVAAWEGFLEEAGVHPLVLALFCDFYMCECNCNGACAFAPCDLADLESLPDPLCDHIKLRAREIVEADEWTIQLIIRRLKH